jgi:hypothetical protein
MENNLIKDYCIENCVAIEFDNHDQFTRINMLFDQDPRGYCYFNSGIISFTTTYDGIGNKITRRFTSIKSSKTYADFIRLTAEEFFILAVPGRSIIEYIK